MKLDGLNIRYHCDRQRDNVCRNDNDYSFSLFFLFLFFLFVIDEIERWNYISDATKEHCYPSLLHNSVGSFNFQRNLHGKQFLYN